jgi:oligopeptide transport system substrate-binding protein
MKSRSFVWMSLLLMVILTISAVSCGPQGPVESPTAEQPTAAVATQPAAQEPTTAPQVDANAPVTEGDLSILRVPRAQIDNLDPGLMPSVNDVDMQRKMFQGLLDYMDDGTELLLGAESYEANQAGDVYTFHLRQNAKWSDGQPVTAKDYVWAWRRTLDPATANPYASTVYIIKNAKAINEGTITDLTQLGVEAVDDYTLKVTLEQPSGFFPRLAAFPTLFPLRQDVVEKYAEKWVEPGNVVCNGPYVPTLWEKDVQLVFERNPYYWGEPAKVAKLVYTLMEDPYSQAPTLYEAGELDLAPFPPEEYARIQADPVLSQQVVLQPQSGVLWVVFDTKNPPFDDVRVRQAFNLAIDREGFANGVLQGLANPQYILIAPGIAGGNEDAYIGTRNYQQDVEKAKQLLSDAGYPNGQGFPEVELKYRTRFLEQKIGESLPAMWQQALGVKVTGAPTEAQAYREWFQSRATQSFNMMVYGWSSDYEDPYNWFNAVFESSADQYHSRWVNQEYDDLVAKAAGEPNPETRTQLYMQADTILESETPLAPVINQVESYMLKPWVQGPVFSRMGNYNLQWGWVVAH